MSGPFVGRDRELTAIRQVFAEGPGYAVVLVGESGVGKTSLAREALCADHPHSGEKFWVAASSSASSIPFGAISHLVPDFNGADRFRIMGRTADWFKARSRGGTAIVVVDDAHHLDEASAALIRHLVSTKAASVVATVRPGEGVPDAVTALWKDGPGQRIDVGPLDRTNTARLLDSLLGGPLQPISEELLWRLSGGNALYLCELVRGGLDSGALRVSDGTWNWAGPVVAAPRLAELVMDRLQDQSPHIRILVDLLAFGEPLAVSDLGRADIPASVIGKAERSGLVRTDEGDRGITVRLAHPIYGEIARELASALHRKHLAGQLLKTTDFAPSPSDLLRRAVWQLDAGGPVEPWLQRQGAIRALAALDLTLAVKLARASIDAGGGVESKCILARTLILRGNCTEAEELLGQLDAGALPALSQAELAASRAWNLAFGLQRPLDADAVLDRAWETVPQGRNELGAQQANLRTYAGHPVEALAAAYLDSTTELKADDATVRKLTATCESLALHGRCVEAVSAGRRAVALNSQLLGGDWSMSQDEAEAGLVGALILCGNFDEADEIIKPAYRRAVSAGWEAGAGMWSVWRGETSLSRGRPASAIRCFQNALASAQGDNHPYRLWLLRLAARGLVQASALLGDAVLAGSAQSIADEHARLWMGALDVWGGSSEAWLAVAQGDSKRGVMIALEAAQRARRDQQYGWEILALHQVVRFGEPLLANKRIHELGRHLDSPLAPLYARHGTALAGGDGPALDLVAQAFHGYGLNILAAEAAAHGARAHRQAGHLASAGVSARHSNDWIAGCEGARTPALLLLTDPVELTRRENEIAHLAASGLTNAQIATNLFISVRTVDNILHRVYEKLGVAGRHELTTAFASKLDQ